MWVQLPSSAFSFFRSAALLVIACLSFAAAGAQAGYQPNFTAESGVNFSSAALHVEQLSSGYRMYFSSSDYFVMSATSTDGLNWGVESGVRISTEAGYYDASSITALGILYSPEDYPNYPYVAYYVGLDINGGYNILKATSADGLVWGKVRDFVRSYPSYVNSVRPYRYDSTHLMLFYTRDSVGVGTPTDSRMYILNSSDKGKTFVSETALMSSATAYNLCFATVTATNMHLYYTAPASGETVASKVYSLTSYNRGLAFLQDIGVRFSTSSAAATLTDIAVVRSTDTYRWRLYASMEPALSSHTQTYGALTMAPFITSISPSKVYQTSAQTSFVITGEIFSGTLNNVALAKGSSVLPVLSWTRDSDTQITAVANPSGVDVGDYTLTVTNSDSNQGTLSPAVNVDIAPGDVSLTDNLFRPTKGGSCRIDVTIHSSGQTKITVYTRTGRKVRTVCDGNASSGTSTYFWDGKNDAGETVASGMYLMVISAPKVESTQKVVVLK